MLVVCVCVRCVNRFRHATEKLNSEAIAIKLIGNGSAANFSKEYFQLCYYARERERETWSLIV